jgi:PilZ domain
MRNAGGEAMSRPGTERRHRRVVVRMPARLASIDAERDPVGGDRWYRFSEETCTNVSRGGALVVSPEPLPTGRRVLVELELPTGESLQTVGRVAWSRLAPSGRPCSFDSGIEFVGANPDQWARLEAFLSAADDED